jgi:hypothetical protein
MYARIPTYVPYISHHTIDFQQSVLDALIIALAKKFL